MIALAYLRALSEDEKLDMKVPESYLTAGDYPTAYAIRPTSNGGVYVFLDRFEEFPGATE